jgi:hypothetical protein
MFADSLFLSTGFLNAEDTLAQGGFAGLAGVPGDLGVIAKVNRVFALALSKTATGTCYAGLYQKVQFLTGSTASNIRGGALFWSDRANFIVTPDATSALEGDFAGIGLMVNTKGYFGVIQVAGKASVKFRATVTDKTNGNLIEQLTTTNTFDAIAESTGTYISGGVKGLKNFVGTALEAPTDAGVNLISLRPLNLNFK